MSQERIEADDFKVRHRQGVKAFTRERRLPFAFALVLVLVLTILRTVLL